MITKIHVVIWQYVGAEFICAVRPILKEKWTAELEEAWKVGNVDVTLRHLQPEIVGGGDAL